MKMKALCEITGLTRKTILYYEEQGFVSPEKTRSNGRDYRDYSDADAKKLLDVSTLRKCGFSIEEIRRTFSGCVGDQIQQGFSAAFRVALSALLGIPDCFRNLILEHIHSGGKADIG